jgi:bifunctional non-homologous end joining protein LigD
MLATNASLPANDEGWSFEVKWDGVRAVAYIEDGALHLESRNLTDITPRYPELAPLAGELGPTPAILDGEVVAFDGHGRPSFGRLQSRMHLTGPAVATRMASTPVAYLVFDLLHLGGQSLFDVPYAERRRLLEDLELAGPAWRTPVRHAGPGEGAALLAATSERGLEGIVAKRLSSLYTPGRRSREWLKVKNRASQEVVIGGWLPGSGSRGGEGRFGALLAGYYDDDGLLRFAGRVGTGFNEAELVRLAGLLTGRERPTSPFAASDRRRIPRTARFVDPELVAEVEFAEWTHTGTMRAPSYKGLRSDKAATDVHREQVEEPPPSD